MDSPILRYDFLTWIKAVKFEFTDKEVPPLGGNDPAWSDAPIC
jgi:hypothetical protein